MFGVLWSRNKYHHEKECMSAICNPSVKCLQMARDGQNSKGLRHRRGSWGMEAKIKTECYTINPKVLMGDMKYNLQKQKLNRNKSKEHCNAQIHIVKWYKATKPCVQHYDGNKKRLVDTHLFSLVMTCIWLKRSIDKWEHVRREVQRLVLRSLVCIQCSMMLHSYIFSLKWILGKSSIISL